MSVIAVKVRRTDQIDKDSIGREIYPESIVAAMELRHLRYFHAVAEEGSFSAAAERLHISQPPLSRQIQDLEAEVDVTLFERGRHGARLTTAGEALYKSTQRLMCELDSSLEHARSVAAGRHGRVRVGYSQIATGILRRAIGQLRASGSTAWLDLEEMNAAEQMQALHRDRIDLALGYRLAPLQHESIQSRRLARSAMQLAVPSKWRRKVRSNPAALNALPLLFLPQAAAPTFHAQALARLASLGIVAHTVRELRAVRSVVLLIGAGDGFGILPSSLEVSEGVQRLAEPDLDLSIETWAFWRTLPPAGERLLEQLSLAGQA